MYGISINIDTFPLPSSCSNNPKNDKEMVPKINKTTLLIDSNVVTDSDHLAKNPATGL